MKALLLIIVTGVVAIGGWYVSTRSNLPSLKNVNVPSQNQNQGQTQNQNNNQRIEPSGPVSGWSLEAHDDKGIRVALCQKKSNDCSRQFEAHKEAVDRIDSEYPNLKGLNDFIEGSRQVYLLNGQGATEYCQNLQEGGHSDWRLPTKDELLKEYENFHAMTENEPLDSYYKRLPSNDPKEIDSFHYGEYWSSSIDPDGLNSVSVSFDDGRTFGIADGNAKLVRCAR